MVGVGIGLALGASLAAWVWVDGRSELRLARSGYERGLVVQADRHRDLESELDAVRLQLRSEAALAKALRGRILLARATTEIDRANFGKTDDLIREAVSALRNVDPEAAGLDHDALLDVAAGVEAISILVSTHAGIQRAELVSQGEHLDRLLDQ